MGRRENKIINIEGRVQFDLLQVSPPIATIQSVYPMLCYAMLFQIKYWIGKNVSKLLLNENDVLSIHCKVILAEA